jgi:hypothetical protein
VPADHQEIRGESLDRREDLQRDVTEGDVERHGLCADRRDLLAEPRLGVAAKPLLCLPAFGLCGRNAERAGGERVDHVHSHHRRLKSLHKVRGPRHRRRYELRLAERQEHPLRRAGWESAREEYRGGCVTSHAFGSSTEQTPDPGAPAVRTNHQELCIELGAHGSKHLIRLSHTDLRPDAWGCQ